MSTSPLQAVYVSNSASGDVATFILDSSKATLTPGERLSLGGKVSTQSVLKSQNRLFVSCSKESSSIESFDIDPISGQLSHHASTTVPYGTAYLFAEPTGRFLLSASYGDNSLFVYRLSDLTGNSASPVCTVTDIPRAHAVITSQDGKHVYASSLKSDRILCFNLDDNGQLSLQQEVTLEEKFGPRHILLSEDEATFFALSELDARVVSLDRDTTSGKLKEAIYSEAPEHLSEFKPGFPRPHSTDNVTLDPETLTDLIWAADIHLVHGTSYLIVSERTSSQLISYELGKDRSLKAVSASSTAQQPRGFNCDNSGHFIIACGEKSDQVILYRIGAEGDLNVLESHTTGQGGNWVSIVNLTE